MFREKNSIRLLWIGGIAAVFAVTVAFGVRRGVLATGRLPEGATAAPVLEAERLSPAGDPNGEYECRSNASVEFAFRIHNRGPNAITGLKLGQTCSCQTNGQLPDRIGPSANATISFRIQAPHAGRVQRRIPLLGDGLSSPLAVLDAALRVKFEPPELFPRSGGHQITFMTGEDTAREFVLETIEARERSPWICGLEIDPRDAMAVNSPRVDELPEADPTLTRRRYQFPVVNHTLRGGRYTSTVRVLTTEGTPPVN